MKTRKFEKKKSKLYISLVAGFLYSSLVLQLHILQQVKILLDLHFICMHLFDRWMSQLSIIVRRTEMFRLGAKNLVPSVLQIGS